MSFILHAVNEETRRIFILIKKKPLCNFFELKINSQLTTFFKVCKLTYK